MIEANSAAATDAPAGHPYRLVFVLLSVAILSVQIARGAEEYYRDSTWKPRAILPAKDALKGDFWPASPKADSTYDDPGFDESRLSKPPPPGVHPRVLVTPDDVERIRAKVALGDKAPAAFRVMWERVKKNRTAFYALVAKDDALGKQLAAELAGKVRSLEPKLDKLDAQPDRDNLWCVEKSLSASGDPDPPSEIWALVDYDYLHQWMSPDERAAAERVIARLTAGRISNFMTVPDHFMINNHQGFGMEFLRLLLLIEGQKGFDQSVYNLAAKKVRAALDWYLDADGMCAESIKGWLNTSALVALGRRDRDLLKHSHLRAKMRFFENAIHWQDGRWQIRDEMRASAFHVIWMMRYFHPNDPALDWLYSATFTTHDFLNDPAAKWPGPVGTSDELLLLFAEDGMRDKNGKPFDWTDQARIDALKLPLTWKDDERGYVITRNSWKKDDIQLGFTCKQDFFYGGHEGSENNRIVMWADGINWLRDSNMLFVKPTFLQNMLTIDGKGLGWPPAPGVWLGVEETPGGLAAAGDGKIGYSFAKVMQVHPLDFPSAKLPYYAPFAEGNFDLTRDQQVAFHPGTVKWNDGYAHTDYGPWSGETRMVEQYRVNNPMEQAYRTVYLARGEHPYVLVLDDARKDASAHLYEWNMTLPEGIDLIDNKTPEIIAQTVTPGPARENDLLLGRASTPRDPKSDRATPGKGDPLLLVRTLWRNSPNGFPVPRFEKPGHVTIPAISDSPEFRVLLYPHRQGDPMPVTEWNSDRTELTVKIGEATDVYRFGKSDGGRTVFSVERNGKPVLQSGATPARPVIEVRGTKFDANDLRTTRLEGSVPTYKFDREVTAKLIRPPAPAFLTYTLDGSEPTEQSARYEAPLKITGNAKLAARVFDPAWTAGPKESAILRADFVLTEPATPAAPPQGSKPGLLARVYEKKTVVWNDRGFFDAAKTMLPDLDKEKPTTSAAVPGFELPFVNPQRPVPEQAKGFYRFTGWFRAPERGVYEFSVDSCGPVAMDVGGQRGIGSTGVFHQQQEVRHGDFVLEAGWHPLDLIVCDPLLWNINTAGEMPFRLSVRRDGGPAESVPADALRWNAEEGVVIAMPPVWKDAAKPPAWLEPGMVLSIFDREGKNRDADYLDTDGLAPIRTEKADRLETNLRPALVRVYDGWFSAPEDGIYGFDLAARKDAAAGLGDLRSAFQNQLRIDDEVVVQRGVAGRRPAGKIGLKKGWHRISLRLGASPALASVTYPDGQTLALSAAEFRRAVQVDIRPENSAEEGSTREIYGPTNISLKLPEGRPATIRYTLDGTEPAATSPVAEKTVTLDRTVTVTAAAFLPDGTSEARNCVQFQLVKIPEAGLVSAARFENWDGKAGATTLDKASTIWIAPGAVAEDGKNGRSIAVHRASAGDGLKPGLDVNVSRGPILAGLKVSGLRMRANAITVGVRFKSDTADGKLFGKDGYNTFGKSYRTVSCSLQKGRLKASPGKISGGQVKPGEWNQVVLTADASASRLYLNGKLVGQGEGSQTLVTDALDFFSNHPAAIDEIRIYERVLTDEDIRRWNDVPHQ